jgi:hypothetical protein
MKTRLLLAAFLASLFGLAAAPPAEAWYRYRYHYGGYGGGYHYNTFNGRAYHGGSAGYNPYTGRYGGSRSYYNPYTGRHGSVQGVYNPYTNRYAYHYGYGY